MVCRETHNGVVLTRGCLCLRHRGRQAAQGGRRALLFLAWLSLLVCGGVLGVRGARWGRPLGLGGPGGHRRGDVCLVHAAALGHRRQHGLQGLWEIRPDFYICDERISTTLKYVRIFNKYKNPNI